MHVLSMREVCEVAVAGAWRLVARRCMLLCAPLHVLGLRTHRALELCVTESGTKLASRYNERNAGEGGVFGVQRLRSWCRVARARTRERSAPGSISFRRTLGRVASGAPKSPAPVASGNEAPRRLRDVELRSLAGPAPAGLPVTTGTTAGLPD